MTPDKKEELKISLLAIIAVFLIIQTCNKFTEKDKVVVPATTTNPVPNRLPTMNDPMNQLEQSNNPAQPVTARTTLNFQQTDVNLGNLKIGAIEKYTYKFTNTGSEVLTINSITGDEGLTIISQPETPVAPGQSGEIKVSLNANTAGSITKTVHLTANSQPPHMHLTISANVQ